MSCDTEKIRFAVVELCRNSPLTEQRRAMSSGLLNESTDANVGPSGPYVSRDLPRSK